MKTTTEVEGGGSSGKHHDRWSNGSYGASENRKLAAGQSLIGKGSSGSSCTAAVAGLQLVGRLKLTCIHNCIYSKIESAQQP